MSWISTEFPKRIALGISCRPGWLTSVVQTQNGSESRNQNWLKTRHSYDASLAVRTVTDYREVQNHFHMARGRLHSWPLKDPLDHRVEASQGVVASTTENSPLGNQLYKRYGSGSFAYDRKITRPISGTIQVYENGTLRTEGVDYTLDYSTGEIFTGISISTLRWAGQFYTPCRYDTDELPASLVQKTPQGEYLVQVDGIPIVEVRE